MRLRGLMLVALGLATAWCSVASAESIVLSGVALSPEEQAYVPAQESGAIKELAVRNGQQVAKGEVLAQIDDLIPQAQYDVAKFKLNVAEQQALNKVDIDYAQAAFEHALTKLTRSLNANKKMPGAVSDDEVDERRLEARKFELAIDKAKKDQEIAALQEGVSRAELDAADANLKHRTVVSPVDGIVTDLVRHQGEWVQEGETILRVIRMDVLRADGRLDARRYLPADVQGRPVNVTMALPHNQKETFPGKIVYVSPDINGGVYTVRAEIQNREREGFWVLSPGMVGEMTVQLK